MDEAELSYTELERRIRELPDGPAKVLDTPRWLLVPNVVGTLGMVLGLLPSLLILLLEPRMWMAYMARAGVWMAFIGYAPDSCGRYTSWLYPCGAGGTIKSHS